MSLEQFLTEEEKRLRLHLEQTTRRLALSGFSVAQLVRVSMPAAILNGCGNSSAVLGSARERVARGKL